MFKKITNLIFYLFVFLVLLVDFIYIFNFCNASSFWLDDLEYSNYYRNERLYDWFLGKTASLHGGLYIGFFLCKFLSFGLPHLLNMHPADFMCFWHGIIKCLFAIIILLLIPKFITIYFKSKLVYAAVLVSLSVSTFYFATKDGMAVFCCNYNYYRYFFSLIFLCIFLYFICKNSLGNYKISGLHLGGVSLCAVCIGQSSEICSFSSVIFCLLIALYNCSVNKSLKLNLNKNFYIPAAFLFLSTILFMASPGFLGVCFEERGLSHISFSSSLVNDFLHLLYRVYFVNLLPLWIIYISLLVCCLLIAARKNELKKIIIPVIIQISLLSVIILLFLCGKTYNNEFYIVHGNIIFLYSMISLLPVLILMGYLFLNIYEKINKKIIRESVILLYAFLLIFPVCKFLIPKICTDADLYSKREFYMSEKMLRFYYLNNKIPVISYEFGSNNNPDGLLGPGELDRNKESKKLYKHNTLTLYYARIYKYEKAEEIGFRLSDNALAEFEQSGGTFSAEELENPRFYKLYDDNFVLGSAEKLRKHAKENNILKNSP